MKKPRLLVYVPGLLALALIVAPRSILDRLTVTDASSRDRYYMWQAGLDMIADKPIFGQGTGMILEVYPKFRWPSAPNPNAPHLHNNFVQIAAERGLPCLFFLGWWLFLLGREAWRVRESAHTGHLVLAALAATLAAGMFEYNLGDSEVLMLTLLLSALPFSTRSIAREPATRDQSEPMGGAPSIETSALVLEQ